MFLGQREHWQLGLQDALRMQVVGRGGTGGGSVEEYYQIGGRLGHGRHLERRAVLRTVLARYYREVNRQDGEGVDAEVPARHPLGTHLLLGPVVGAEVKLQGEWKVAYVQRLALCSAQVMVTDRGIGPFAQLMLNQQVDGL